MAARCARRAIPGLSAVPHARKAHAALRQVVSELISRRLKADKVAGAAISIVLEGETIICDGYGYADLEQGVRVSADSSLFRVGSVSKTFTWTAVMQLVDQGIVDLTTDIGRYLDFSIPRKFRCPITLQHLMTHTAGFESNHFGYMAAWTAQESETLALTVKRHIPAQIWKPGEVAAYSNWGAALAGRIVELASGRDFDDYVEDRLFEPLEMGRSTFREPIPFGIGCEPIGYVFDGDQLVEHPFEHYHSVGPAGSLTTTARDMAHFMSAHLNGGAFRGTRVLTEQSAEAMRSRVCGHPCLDGATLGFYETFRNGHRTIGHKGATVCFESRLTLVPDEQLGIFVACNSGPGAAFCDAIVNGVLNELLSGTLPPMESPPDSHVRLPSYCGKYAYSARSHTKSEKVLSSIHTINVRSAGDRLVICGLTHEPDSEWIEVAEVPGVFRRVNTEEMIAFQRVASGGRYRLLGPEPLNSLEPITSVGTSNCYNQVLQLAPISFSLTGAGAFLLGNTVWPLLSWAAIGLALTHILVAAGLFKTLEYDQYTLLVKLPWTLVGARLLASASVPLTVAVSVGAIMCWGPAASSLLAGAVSALALLALGFTYWLGHWNLVGFDAP